MVTQIAQAAPQTAPQAIQEAPQIVQAAPQTGTQTASLSLFQHLTSTTAGIGVLGGIVGISVSIAKNIRGYQEGEVSTKNMIYDAGKEGVGSGVATVAGALAVGAIGGGLALSLGTAIAAATATKYVWDRDMDRLDTIEAEREEQPAKESTEKEAVVDKNDSPEFHRRGYEL